MDFHSLVLQTFDLALAYHNPTLSPIYVYMFVFNVNIFFQLLERKGKLKINLFYN